MTLMRRRSFILMTAVAISAACSQASGTAPAPSPSTAGSVDPASPAPVYTPVPAATPGSSSPYASVSPSAATPDPFASPAAGLGASPVPASPSALASPSPSPDTGGSPPASPSTAPAEDKTLRLQVLLDRAHFSPGEIDGRDGGNTRVALESYRRERGSRGTNGDTLESDTTPYLVEYTLTPQDVAGPFTPDIPEDMMAKAKLPALGYTSPLEALSERFHSSPALLRKLNPQATFTRAGERIRAPNVHTEAPGKAASVLVDGSGPWVAALDAQGRTIAVYPATAGSQHDPLPVGKWKVNGVSREPHFNYNPDLFWDAEPGHGKARIAPGPNNPVGVVWIDLSKPHYGIHGTPEPATIGKTQSHGCIRLTNWDAAELAGLVAPGAPVVIRR